MRPEWVLRFVATVAVIGLLGLTLSGCAGQQAKYPSKPIQVIVPYPAGGGVDVAARMVANYAEKYAGQKFVVVNKAGAGGEIGLTALAQAEPDGYTIGFTNLLAAITIAVKRGAECKYKMEDFLPIANVVLDPGAVAVRADSPWKDMNDLVNAAKANPGVIPVAYGGPGTTEAYTVSRVESQKGVTFNKIPFDGTAPMLAALLGKHVDAVFMNASEALPNIKEGKVKLLGVGSAERSKVAPNIPTFKEQGFDIEQYASRGFIAPAKLDPAKARTLAEIIKKVLDDPEFIKKAEESQLPLNYLDAEAFAKSISSMNERLNKEWKTNPW
ncbi:MAG TPA: tripartite tricarboxylate transporter substrate binding protein [Firmicutes bacterium]|nr:tripartite tricarboxylate transporter substrate binding protein [Bacillota bacterium]